MEKWEVKVLPADSKANAFLGVYCGGKIVLAPIRNREEGELICAAVNAIRACAEPLGVDPLDFAKRLEGYPEIGPIVVYATEAVADLVRHVVEGEPLEGGLPIGSEPIRRVVVPKGLISGLPPLEGGDDERPAAPGTCPGDA